METQQPTFATVKQASKVVDGLSENALRMHVFAANRNGLAPAIHRVGRRVLIDLDALRRWIRTGSAA